MAPTIREIVPGVDNDGVLSISLGAGTQAGDGVVVIASSSFYDIAQFNTPPDAPVGGWGDLAADTSGATNASVRSWERSAAGGAETITISHDQTGVGTAPILGVVAYVFEGPITVEDAVASNGSSEGSHTAPSGTADTAGALLICGWTSRGAGTYTVPGSMTKDAEPNQGSGSIGAHLGTAHEVLVSSGVTGTRTATQAADSWDAFAAVTIIVSAAAGSTVDIGQATATDTAFALTRSKSRTIGQPAETDTATPIGRAKARTIGQALSVEVAHPIGIVKSRTIGIAGTADTAAAIAATKARTIGSAPETSTAHPVARAKARAVGQVTATDIALALEGSGPPLTAARGAVRIVDRSTVRTPDRSKVREL